MELADFRSQEKIKRSFRAIHKFPQSGVISHVTQRGVGKEPIFLEEHDYLSMLTLLQKSSEKNGIQVLAFCLTQNYVDFLVRPDGGNLPHAMRDIFSPYARLFNRKHGRSGYVFGGLYQQAVCLDPSCILASSVYIHLNPVRAGLTDEPIKYLWSSAALYDKPHSSASFVDPSLVLNLLSEDPRKGVQRYRTLLRTGSGIDSGHVLEQKDAIDQIREALLSTSPGISERLCAPQKVARVSSGMELLNLEEVERQIEALKAAPEKDPDTRRAKKFIIEQLLARGFKQYEIAKRLEVTTRTLYNILKETG